MNSNLDFVDPIDLRGHSVEHAEMRSSFSPLRPITSVEFTDLARIGHHPSMRVVLRAGRLAWGVGACALALGVAGCGKTANEGGAPAGVGGAGASGGGQASAGASNASGGSAASGTSDSGAGGEANGEDGSLTPEPSDLRRLTAAEYEATATDVLGTSLKPDLATFATEVDGFDNNAAANGVGDDLYLRYLQTAEDLASEVFASDALRPQIVTCSAVDDATCVRSVVSQVGLRLFRRPVLEEELVSYQKVYTRARARQDDHEAALEEVLIALLASAQFLYRMEFVPTASGTQPLGPYDMATRLSYLLWSSAPDPKLLDAAAQGALSSDDQLVETAGRLLADPKSSRLGQNFAGQWLGAPALTSLQLDAQLFPEWTPDVATAAADEIEAYFDELLQQDEDIARFLDSPAHFVTPPLGALYGLSVNGSQRVELKGVDRQGFLGLVGFLAQTSAPTRSSPSARGSWILQRLLCSPVPDPPANMPPFTASEDSIASYLQGLESQAACSTCHGAIDPPGLALENYDALGRYRSTYSSTKPIDPHVMLLGSGALPGGVNVTGAAGLSQALASAPAFDNCVAQKLYTYGFGRAFADSERPNVQALANEWRRGPTTLRELILRLIKSPTFRFRSDGGGL